MSEFYTIQNKSQKIRVVSYEGRTSQIYENRKSVDRYLFNIVDLKDRKTKILSVGKMVADEIFARIVHDVQPKKNWFMCFLERLGFVRRASEPVYDFNISKEEVKVGRHFYPKYKVEPL